MHRIARARKRPVAFSEGRPHTFRTMSELYFAYGSNMSRARLEARVGGVRPRGRAALSNFELSWNKPGRDGSGKANVRAQPGAVTFGVLYALTENQWPALDGFEPGYARETRVVRDDAGSEANAQLYRFRSDGPELPPTAQYLDLVLRGARENGLPEEVFALLARWRTGRIAP